MSIKQNNNKELKKRPSTAKILMTKGARVNMQIEEVAQQEETIGNDDELVQ